ncbi:MULTISPECIES: Asp23/Gls24 family envelope stress response protein [unclassified Streptomyces]|uniref:Asp23/Gls24 family envelope stress response protein n=1 Tax=unclassified Streptomyces TaxID=2593676 RepID=UPI002E0E2F3C|nr:Asp23/Gls24 family envelope stress response protein [Streptomyces sp. NBC_01296]WSW59041.1 Asp23/Gls24 family envelope stress response protein [Streptomyces sp. NBC_00998]
MTTPRVVPPHAPPAERGATRIADRVVAKIAAQAAREALAAQPDGPPRAVGPAGAPGSAGAATGQAAPHATVTVHHDIARVRVSLELDYPCDLAARCAAVRSRVVRRVEEYAGMSVPEVDIDIEHLHSAHTRTAALRDRKPR